MKCPSCGSIVEDSSKICGVCGRNLSSFSRENTNPQSYGWPVFHIGPPDYCPICGQKLDEENGLGESVSQTGIAGGSVKRAYRWNQYYVHIKKIHRDFDKAQRSLWKFPVIVGGPIVVYILGLFFMPNFRSWLFGSPIGIVSLFICFFGIVMLRPTPGLVRRYLIHKYSKIWSEIHAKSPNP